jgi:hypothetical protein
MIARSRLKCVEAPTGLGHNHVRLDPESRKLLILNGEMSEWSIEHAWKACVGETLPWVRIPLSPPHSPKTSVAGAREF